VTEVAAKRLEAIRDYAEFGAGFKIAIRDLEIRGAGNLLGSEQHGHLDAIGYELYIKLLNEAVLEERGEKIPERVECTVTLKCDAYIPDKYVEYSAQRMGLYKRMAMIETPEDNDDIIDELIDRYGDIPKATMNLHNIALVRSAAMKCGVSSIVEDVSDVRIYPEDFDMEIWSELSDIFKNRLRVAIGEKVCVHFRFKKEEDLPVVMYTLFSKYLECQKNING
jgi:transcription-repair coupling factor (superfamily II helicase)